jgi:hypothetical protein
MPSLLVTRKMAPELAARVQASVEDRRAPPGARLAPRAISLLRFMLFAALVFALVWFVTTRQRAADQLELDRSALLARIRRHSKSLTAPEKALEARALPWLARAAGPYEGDFIGEELRSPGALGKILARPTVYVRGPVGSFMGSAGVRQSAATSSNDAFVLCLIHPPSEKTEKLVRAKARASFARAGEMQHVAHVERLYDALAALPLLTSKWQARVAGAERREFDKLRHSFEIAPVEGAKRAAKARSLLFVMDEPGSGLAELDGERPHDARVGLIELATGKTLLRLRRHVDPSWVSEATRAQYAASIDSCALALDVRQGVGM